MNLDNRNFILLGVGFSLFSMIFIFKDYLAPIVVGFVLTMATSPIYLLLIKRVKSRAVVSTLLTATLFLFVFLPLIYIIATSYKSIPTIEMRDYLQSLKKLTNYLQNLPDTLSILQEPVNAILKEFNLYSIDISMLKSTVSNIGVFLFEINSVVYQFFLILFFYFVFNLYSGVLFFYLMKLIPLKRINKRLLFTELTNTISSVFFGTLFSMFMQGFAFGVFISLFSSYDGFYLGLMAGFVTAIPIVGTYLIAIPIALLELLNQNYLFAISSILFALFIMSGLIDNLFRVFFMKYINRKFKLNYSISEFLVLTAMVAGISTFGGWGIILAPALLSLNLAFIHIYKISNRIN